MGSTRLEDEKTLLYRFIWVYILVYWKYVAPPPPGVKGRDIDRCKLDKGGQTAILVRWSAAQRTTEMVADQRTGKNSGPAPADYRN
jgi:hypothetical protein